MTIAGSRMVRFAGQELLLLPECALWWPAAESLVIADLHLGKAAAFRAHGIPVPSGSTLRDLLRLSNLLESTNAKRLVILGDFLHARAGRQPEVVDEFRDWRARQLAEILLIRGNHDRSAGRVETEWDIQELEEPHLDNGLALLHHPDLAASCPALAGHVHPVVHLQDFDGSLVRVPAFIQDAERLILPAFGTFTGGYSMGDQPERSIYLVMSGRIIAKRAPTY